jgi:hypothetical protein
MPSTAGFTDASTPKPVILAPKGSTPIVSGIAVSMQNDNQGAVGVKWMAAPGSFMDDVTINCSRTKTGTELLYGLWIADGGAGTFKGIWTPSESATAGLIVTDTSTPGAMYQMSIEHHRRVEIILRNVSNWTFNTIQTEEVNGDEATASMEMGEFRVCSGAVSVSEGGVRQFRGCKTTNCIGAFSESRRPGT